MEVNINRPVMESGESVAKKLAELFDSKQILVLNLISSPGAGKTSLLERTLNARLRLQAELQQQVDSLQGEVSELRGQLEQQTYQMEQSQERQRQLYQELDKVASSQQAAPAAAAPAGVRAAAIVAA